MHGTSKSPKLLAALLFFAAVAGAQKPSATSSSVPVSTPPSNPPQPAAVAAQGAPPASSAPAVAPMPNISATLRPALDQVQNTLFKVHTERWKRGSVRDEAGADIGSIKTDMQSNLPNLLHDADASPGTLSKMLPVSKHIDALYDVLLRVVEAARMAAPDDQADALRQALGTLGTARLAFDDQMQQSAANQEKQIVDLRTTVQKQAAFKCPAPPPVKPCPPPPPTHTRKKPAASSSTTPSTTNQQKPAAAPSATTNQQKPAAGAQKPGTTQQPQQKPGQQPQKPSSTSPNQQH